MFDFKKGIKECGSSIEEVAKELGITPSAVYQRLNNGNIRFGNLLEIAIVCGVTPEELIKASRGAGEPLRDQIDKDDNFTDVMTLADEEIKNYDEDIVPLPAEIAEKLFKHDCLTLPLSTVWLNKKIIYTATHIEK